ncbi:alpha/beta hydrolase [Haloferax namakaokahaiae]|uniref:Alpha/beta hydrolase n=1 Tax=Haloferax namakaokahaiae TaxID=1748331 RepID=A0ABD5ZJX0_9EURY
MTRDRHPSREVRELIHHLEENSQPLDALSVEEARQQQESSLTGNSDVERVEAVRDREIEVAEREIPIRIYKPMSEGPHPVVVFYHGGGWVLGNIDTHDALCRVLTNTADAIVVSVEYRLAPENPFPAAIEDCYEAVVWATENGESIGADPNRLAVAGVSAGGNLAAVVTQVARDEGYPDIDYQVLMCPATDFSFETKSYAENGEGYLLSDSDMRWFWRHYLPHPLCGNNPYASPLRACDFSKLPRATVLTAGFDPLRDEGRRYAERLRRAGVAVRYRNYEQMIHGFMSRLNGPRKLSPARDAIEDVGCDLRDTFGN